MDISKNDSISVGFLVTFAVAIVSMAVMLSVLAGVTI